MVYLYTLDSHDCFGTFPSFPAAHAWAVRTGKNSYQLLNKPPFESTVVHKPYDADVAAYMSDPRDEEEAAIAEIESNQE